jgi:CBS domain-containing protein
VPITVAELLDGRRPVVTIKARASLRDALKLMIEHDFSQLPVVDDDGKLQGLVTADSIVRRLDMLGITTAAATVTDVKTVAVTATQSNDLFEIMPSLETNYSVVIVDTEGKVVGVLTNYDTSRYFKARAEDVMRLADIERTVRDFILAAFPDARMDETNSVFLQAIDGIAKPPSGFDDFRKALAEYLKSAGISGAPKKEACLKAFEILAGSPIKQKTFGDLDFSEYIAMWLHRNRWQKYKAAIGLDPKNINHMMENVRLIRNKVAHFKGEVTATERQVLVHCLEWLENQQPAVIAAFPASTADQEAPTIVELGSEFADVVDEQPALPAKRLKYSGLSDYFATIDKGYNVVRLKFTRVEEIIGSELPPFARRHRSWWANDTTSRAQSRQWLESGWRVASVDMVNEEVRFARNDKPTFLTDIQRE